MWYRSLSLLPSVIANCCIADYISFFFFFKQKTAYEMRISDCSSDVCSSDLELAADTRFRPIADAGIGFCLRPADRRGGSGDCVAARRRRPLAVVAKGTPAVEDAERGGRGGRGDGKDQR